MIPRYTRLEMAAVWEPQTRFRIWFEIEAHASDAMAELGIIPKEAAYTIWEKAKNAKRYEPKQFPYMNLGRIYVKQGRWFDALREFEVAVRLAPSDAELRRALHSLRGRLN